MSAALNGSAKGNGFHGNTYAREGYKGGDFIHDDGAKADPTLHQLILKVCPAFAL